MKTLVQEAASELPGVKSFLPRTLRAKLLGLVLGTSLVALVVAITAMVAYDLHAYHQGWVNDVATQAELLGQTSAPALAFDDAQVAKDNLNLLRFRPKIRAAAIYNAKGALFARYLAEGEEPGFPALPEADGTRVDKRDLIVFKRIVDHGEIAGTVYLRADYELYPRIIDYAGIALLVMLVAMFIAFLMSSWLQAIVTRPILAIGEVAREVVTQRDYSRRAEKLSDDEVGVLVESFNDMLSEIEKRTRDIESSNHKLALEIEERRRSEVEIARLNTELEDRVRERTLQLEVANQELEAFCSSVSHDLRAPLRAIDGFSQALVEDFAEGIPEEGRRYLSRIRVSAQRMSDLIEDLLNLSQVSRAKLAIQPVDVGDIARQVVADLRLRDPDRVVDVSIWEGMQADADPGLLRAALENLVGNAWKFSSRADKPRIEIGVLRDREQSTFYVRDNGAGFDMAFKDKLFGTFQRLHSASDFPGTGVGLATVQRIIHRHGGRIWADAQVGKGAVFYFTLAGDDSEEPSPSVERAS